MARTAPSQGVTKPVPWPLEPAETVAFDLWRDALLVPAWERSPKLMAYGAFRGRATEFGTVNPVLAPWGPAAESRTTGYLNWPGSDVALRKLWSGVPGGSGLTVICLWTHRGAPDVNHAPIFGQTQTGSAFNATVVLKRNVTTSPNQFNFVVQGTVQNGGASSRTAIINLAVNQTYLLIGQLQPNFGVVTLAAYNLLTGTQVAGDEGLSLSPIVAVDDSTEPLAAGGHRNRRGNGVFHGGGIWPRALRTPELQRLRDDFFTMFRPSRTAVTPGIALAGAPEGTRVSPAFLPDASAVFAPAVQVTPLTLAPAFLPDASAVFAPAVSRTPLTLAPAFLPDASAVFAPAVQVTPRAIAPAFLPDASAVFAPAVQVTPRAVLVDTVEDTSAIFEPTVWSPGLVHPLQGLHLVTALTRSLRRETTVTTRIHRETTL